MNHCSIILISYWDFFHSRLWIFRRLSPKTMMNEILTLFILLVLIGNLLIFYARLALQYNHNNQQESITITMKYFYPLNLLTHRYATNYNKYFKLLSKLVLVHLSHIFINSLLNNCKWTKNEWIDRHNTDNFKFKTLWSDTLYPLRLSSPRQE